MLGEAARREFIAIITLDGLSEAALHTHCLPAVCVSVCVCVFVSVCVHLRACVHT